MVISAIVKNKAGRGKSKGAEDIKKWINIRDICEVIYSSLMLELEE